MSLFAKSKPPTIAAVNSSLGCADECGPMKIPLTGGRPAKKCSWERFREGAKSRPLIVRLTGVRIGVST